MQRRFKSSLGYCHHFQQIFEKNGCVGLEAFWHSSLGKDPSCLSALVDMKNTTGDALPSLLYDSFYIAYPKFKHHEKQEWITRMATDLNVNSEKVTVCLQKTMDLQSNKKEDTLLAHQALRHALIPTYETLFTQMMTDTLQGMRFVVHFRTDLIHLLKQKKKISKSSHNLTALKIMDDSLKSTLCNWFSPTFLQVERVTFESPGTVLEAIMTYEAVHPVRSIHELKRRLGHGRRCFGIFHPSLPQEPLVFIHVALLKGVANSMDYIKIGTSAKHREEDADTAIFYSISSTTPGLQGIDLGNFLIKKVASSLSTLHPTLTTFATLSPMPLFITWLQSEAKKENKAISFIEPSSLSTLQELSNISSSCSAEDTLIQILVNSKEWILNQELNDALKPIVMHLAGVYLYHEKQNQKAYCPVANFHLRNGASLYQINWLADLSNKGIAQSAGIMVNYKYDLKCVEVNNAEYIAEHHINLGTLAREWIQT